MNPLRRSRRCLLVILLAAPVTASPAEAAAPLSWSDVAAIVATSPSVREADARLDGASGSVSSAASLPNPTFTVMGGNAEARNGPERRREWGVSVEVPLEYRRDPRPPGRRGEGDGARGRHRGAGRPRPGTPPRPPRVHRARPRADPARGPGRPRGAGGAARRDRPDPCRARRGAADRGPPRRDRAGAAPLRHRTHPRRGGSPPDPGLDHASASPSPGSQADLERAIDVPPLPELEARVARRGPERRGRPGADRGGVGGAERRAQGARPEALRRRRRTSRSSTGARPR